jgi:hypothetical protein
LTLTLIRTDTINPQISRKLKATLALAQYKTTRGWENLSLSAIEPKVEEELRLKRPLSSGDILSDSSSSSASTSEFQFPVSRNLMSSPLKEAAIFDQVGPRSGSRSGSGYPKRTYRDAFEFPGSSSSKKYRSSPTTFRNTVGRSTIAFTALQQTRSSPIKPRKQPHFTTSNGPGISFYSGASPLPNNDHCTNFASLSDDEENSLPVHSFNHIRSSPPRTPPPNYNRGSGSRRNKDKDGKLGEEGADLLLFLATSPSPANPTSRTRMAPPSTPPPKNPALPSSMMNTPGGGTGLLSIFGGPNTPSSNFNFEDYVNVTPSPGQWPKTPRTVKTPATVNRRNLDFDSFIPPLVSPAASKRTGLGMQLGELLP